MNQGLAQDEHLWVTMLSGCTNKRDNFFYLANVVDN